MDLQEHGRALSGKLTSKLSSIRSMRWFGRKTSSTDTDTDQDKGSSDLTALGFGTTVVGLVFAVCLIAPTLVCLRIEGNITWSWGVVTIPLWVFNGLYLCAVWGTAIIDINDGQSTIRRIFLTTTSALSLMSQIFIVLKLDGNLDWSVVHAAIPYFVYEGLNLMDACFISGDSLSAIVRIVQMILIALKIDGSINSSWWTVLIPSWIAVGFVFLVALVFILISIFLPDDGDDKSVMRLLAFGFATVVGLVFAPYFIVAARLESSSFSTFYILLPLYVLVGVLILLGLGMLVACKCCSSEICKDTDFTDYTAIEGQA